MQKDLLFSVLDFRESQLYGCTCSFKIDSIKSLNVFSRRQSDEFQSYSVSVEKIISCFISKTFQAFFKNKLKLKELNMKK